MKIGIDASRYSSNNATGVEWYSFYIINSLLAHKSNNDDFVCYSKDPLKIKGTKNVVLKTKRLWTLMALSKEMKKNPPDVLFVPSHTLPLNLPGRSVIMIHDIAFKYLRSSYSFIQYHYLNWSTKFAVKNASKILVPSKTTKKDLMKFYKCPAKKIEVVIHGFTPPPKADLSLKNYQLFKDMRITEKTKYFLFVGRLESKKNLENLIEAFSLFSKKHKNFKMVLAGSRGLGFKRILKKMNSLHMMDKVLMPGYVTEDEKAALYANCQAFVFPSLYEGFGLPILEAFYYKKPVVCSISASLPEVALDCAFYIHPLHIESIKQGLEKIVEEKDYVKSLIDKGSKRLLDFSWDKTAEKTLKIIHG